MAQRLQPITETLRVRGKVSYEYSSRASSLIRLKRDFIAKFPQLKQKMTNISYEMLLHPDFQKLIEDINQMESKGEPVPILLFLEE